MKIPRMTVITLGVADLHRATKFYEAVLGARPDTSNDGVTFFQLPGVWLSGQKSITTEEVRFVEK